MTTAPETRLELADLHEIEIARERSEKHYTFGSTEVKWLIGIIDRLRATESAGAGELEQVLTRLVERHVGHWIKETPPNLQLFPVAARQDIRDLVKNIVAALPSPRSPDAGLREATIEQCAKCVPSNWCDSLLTGPKAGKTPLDCRGVEQLLRGIQDRIRALRLARSPGENGGGGA